MASTYNDAPSSEICPDHPERKISCFCGTCNNFICSACAKGVHRDHDWDIIASSANNLQQKTTSLCQRITDDMIPKCRQRLQEIDDNILAEEKRKDDDMQNLEDRRTAMIDAVNEVANKMKQARDKLPRKESTALKRKRLQLGKTMKYLENIAAGISTESKDSSQVTELEKEMLKISDEVESYDTGNCNQSVRFVTGELNHASLEEMFGDSVEQRDAEC